MATVGTLVTNLIANTSKFSGPMKKAQKDVGGLEAQFKKLEKSIVSTGLKFLTVEKGLSFVKNTVKAANTAGSELQKALGTQGVQAAEKLSEAIGKIELALQKTVITLLNELAPAIEKVAEIASNLADRIGGGPQGKLKDIAEQRKNLGPETPQEALDRMRTERTQVEREIATLQDKWFLGPEARNQLELLEIRLGTLNFEISSYEGALKDLNNAVAGKALVDKLGGLAGIADQVGKGLLSDVKSAGEFFKQTMAGRAAQSVWDKARAVAEGAAKAVEEATTYNREKAMSLHERVKTDQEQFNEMFEEAERLVKMGLFSLEDLGRLAGEDPRIKALEEEQRKRADALKTEEDAIAARVGQLMNQEEKRPELAVKGTNEFLKAIHTDSKDEKKDIKQLVRIAQQELEQERRQAREIADEINRSRVTVNMP